MEFGLGSNGSNSTCSDTFAGGDGCDDGGSRIGGGAWYC